jgi:hypothetical protein
MSRWLKWPNAFFKLSFSDKVLALRVLWVLCIIKICLKVLSFEKFKTLYNRSLQQSNLNLSNEAALRTIYLIKGLAYYMPLGFTCLPQALALKYFMAADKTAQVIIGVNNTGGFKAHAWVEKNTKFLIGDLPLENYTPIWQWA